VTCNGFFWKFNEKGMQMDQYFASRLPWLESYKKVQDMEWRELHG
jgi:hypothetical protein